MFEIFDEAVASLMTGLHQPVESFIQLETADDETTLVAADGSLITFVKNHGSRVIVGETEYNWIVDQATIKLGARFDRPGYAMQFYFARDPSLIGQDLEGVMNSNRSAMKAEDLELGDLIEERATNLSRYMAHEDMYLVLWTRPSVLTKTELAEAKKDLGKKKWIRAPDSQFPLRALPVLRTRHKSFVASVTSAMEELSMKVSVIDVHEALAAVRASLSPHLGHKDWRANLPGDPILPRAPQHGERDASDILWPPIRRQLCVEDAGIVASNIVRIGPLFWSGLDMTLAPSEPAPFTQLLDRLIDSDMPFRISFLVESGGIYGMAFKAFVAGVLGFTNAVNKDIRNTILELNKVARAEPVVKLRISMATYAPSSNRKLIETRIASMTQTLEAWGYCQASSAAGDPLDMLMSSALGIACASTAPAVVAPFHEVVKLFPWQRGSSPYTEGSVMFRTVDGRAWPYQSGTSLTSLWFDLIFAQPGAGKSVLMNALNLGTVLSAGASSLPYVAILDIGPSSSGLISLIRDALPPERRYEAVHIKLRMTPEYAVNPFDTQLGCRFPLPEERSYLTDLLTLLCTPAGQIEAYDGMTQLVGLCIDEMYRWRDDGGANSEPRPYLQRVEAEVDETLKKYNINLQEDPLWWEVVDALFEKGAYHEAMLAQRHAVPTLSDAVTAARRPQIRALLEETQIGASSEGIIHAFERMIATSVREFPILASITKFDVGAARVVAMDLQDVSPQGDVNADRQTATMYMLARHVVARLWWLGTDMLRSVPEKYRNYHESRIRDIRETPKRICYDEFHRTSRSPSVRAQVIRDVREGRKWGVQIVLASQLLDDFSKDMVDLATGVWICGTAVSDRAIEETGKIFGLSDTAKWVMRYKLTGPRSSGAPVLLLLSTNEGRYEQHLVNTLGPIELWALSTSVEDVLLRTHLYEELGAVIARRTLAKYFPGGSARQEVRRRVAAYTDRGNINEASTSSVIAEMAKELVEYAHEDPATIMRQ
ncbi:MAG: type IV secretion protein IcmB [Alphaproteobacteria bacterium]|nr:type IV secretion protein IcmB [Alphaproteobacteria bacterium]MCL2504908.1 type IV secretion protein IcmB [Alphaproteobacteria bacterium]